MNTHQQAAYAMTAPQWVFKVAANGHDYSGKNPRELYDLDYAKQPRPQPPTMQEIFEALIEKGDKVMAEVRGGIVEFNTEDA